MAIMEFCCIPDQVLFDLTKILFSRGYLTVHTIELEHIKMPTTVCDEIQHLLNSFSFSEFRTATNMWDKNFWNDCEKRSLLSVTKTHKTNVVHMDIHRHHTSLSLLKTCSKRKLSYDEEPACTADNAPSDTEDDDFECLAQNLINMATADEAFKLLIPPTKRKSFRLSLVLWSHPGLAVILALKSQSHHSLILPDPTTAWISTGKGLSGV